MVFNVAKILNFSNHGKNTLTFNHAYTALACLMSIVWASSVASSPITYTEIFEKNLAVKEGQRAIYNFDLGSIGGNSFVKDGKSIVSSIFTPTTDETNFDGSHIITSALLSFEIGGMDGGNFAPRERIKIKVKGENGTVETIFNKTVYLGVKQFDFDLTSSQLNLIDDGKLKAISIAVNRKYFDNDFKMRRASLTVNAVHNVPEPASFLLLGSGLLGLMFYRNRRKNRIQIF